MAFFGGWIGIDMYKDGDDEELRYVESNAIRSFVESFASSEPGAKGWSEHTVARHLMIEGRGPTPTGTSAQVADGTQKWINEADVDDFNVPYAIFLSSFEDVVEPLVPDLTARGSFVGRL